MNNIFGFIHIDFCTSSGDASVGMNIVWMKAEQNRSPVVFNLAALLWQQCTILKERLKVGFPSIFSALHSSLVYICGFRKLVTQAVAAQPIVSPQVWNSWAEKHECRVVLCPGPLPAWNSLQLSECETRAIYLAGGERDVQTERHKERHRAQTNRQTHTGTQTL